MIFVAATYFFMPATASAPDGSAIERVSLKMSLIAPQISSLDTTMTESTQRRAILNVSLPTCATDVPSANRSSVSLRNSTRLLAASAAAIQAEPSASTPMIFTSGRRYLTYAPMPEMRPPPPTGTKIACSGPLCWFRISMPTVPCPAITSGIVERMHEHVAVFVQQFGRVVARVVEIVAVQNHVRAVRAHRFDFDLGRVAAHHDVRANAEAIRGERNALRVIAGRRAHHAARAILRRELRHLVVCSAQLEREHRLQVLALQEHTIADAARQRARFVQRRFERHVIDARSQDFLDVVFEHRIVDREGRAILKGEPNAVHTNARAHERRRIQTRRGRRGGRDDQTASAQRQYRWRRHRFDDESLHRRARVAARSFRCGGREFRSDRATLAPARHRGDRSERRDRSARICRRRRRSESARQLIKGAGGALTREKIVAASANEFICIVDDSKLVDLLGCVSGARSRSYRVHVVSRRARWSRLGGTPIYRDGVVTDNGNIILDVRGLDLTDPLAMEQRINNIVGVVCNGIFAAQAADVVIIAGPQGIRTIRLIER